MNQFRVSRIFVDGGIEINAVMLFIQCAGTTQWNCMQSLQEPSAKGTHKSTPKHGFSGCSSLAGEGRAHSDQPDLIPNGGARGFVVWAEEAHRALAGNMHTTAQIQSGHRAKLAICLGSDRPGRAPRSVARGRDSPAIDWDS